MSAAKTIGILGGLGPYAGLDLARKIFDQTDARTDGEHLPVALVSMPGEIEDRTAFLLDKTDVNPAYAIAELIGRLADMGADIIGMPCNTAHHPKILDVVLSELGQRWPNVRMINMLEETASHLRETFAPGARIGLLSTTGIANTGIYREVLRTSGVEVLPLSAKTQDAIHEAIYSKSFGIKAFSNPVTDAARGSLINVISDLGSQGAEAVVLGCTELPLAVPQETVGPVQLIDPTWILARALIREACPERLRPLKTAQ